MIGSFEKRRGITSKSEPECFTIYMHAYPSRFHSFFHHLDHYRTEHFLWVTAKGVAAAKQSHSRKEDISDDEVDINGEEG